MQHTYLYHSGVQIHYKTKKHSTFFMSKIKCVLWQTLTMKAPRPSLSYEFLKKQHGLFIKTWKQVNLQWILQATGKITGHYILHH